VQEAIAKGQDTAAGGSMHMCQGTASGYARCDEAISSGVLPTIAVIMCSSPYIQLQATVALRGN